jgi:hypothetical protein
LRCAPQGNNQKRNKDRAEGFSSTELHRFTRLRIGLGAQDANAGVLSQGALIELTSLLQAVLSHISLAAWSQDHAVIAFKDAYYQAAFPRFGFRLIEKAAAPQIIIGGKGRNTVARQWPIEDSNREGPFAFSGFDESDREVLFSVAIEISDSVIGMIVSAFLFAYERQSLFVGAVGFSREAQAGFTREPPLDYFPVLRA